MSGPGPLRCLALSLLAGLCLPAAPARAQAERPRVIGEHRRDVVLETPHPYPGRLPGSSGPVWTDRYSFPGAAYLVFEFTRFHLAPGDWVEVHDPERRQVHVYRGRGPGNRGGDFITKLVIGSEAIIDLYSTHAHPSHYGYRIERITRGYGQDEIAGALFAPESVCGTDDQEDAVCYETSHPQVYERSRAVAMIVMDGFELCTAWLASCDNHLITNDHCTWDEDLDFNTQGELDRMEFLFMYQDATCGADNPSFEYSFMGGTWLESDPGLDYTLVQAPAGEDPAATYGWLQIDDRLPDVDEPIYIVGFPDGRPKEISLYSTHPTDQDNPDGFCEVASVSEPPCLGGPVPEIGYYCDTEPGNSGSPVLSHVTQKVVALHHCGTCANLGVRMESIWDANQAGSHPLPACSVVSGLGVLHLDGGTYACGSTIGISVHDGSLAGGGNVNVTLSSAAEPAGETVTLVENGAATGVFTGSIGTTVGPAAADGLLSVTDGDTVTALYVDADDGQGGVDVPVQVTAVIDCAPPGIGNVAVVELRSDEATVTWDTDEPSDSVVSHGTSAPFGSTASDGSLVMGHAVTLFGLSECTDYVFAVQSTDASGNTAVDDDGGAYYTFSTPAASGGTFPSTDTPKVIVDEANVVSTISVPDTETVVDVNLTVNITHTYTSDLDLLLRAPNGVEIVLASGLGASGDDYAATTFDDEAPTSITGATPPFTGSFRPETPLSTFDGVGAAGDWRLRVYDGFAGDTGTLDSWSLDLAYTPLPCGDPPGEQTGVAWTGGGILGWDEDPAATAGYSVYRGTAATLPALTDPGVDGCEVFTGAGPADHSADLAADIPPAGTLHWYLVTGRNAFGEGTAGPATATLRILNPSGPCP